MSDEGSGISDEYEETQPLRAYFFVDKKAEGFKRLPLFATKKTFLSKITTRLQICEMFSVFGFHCFVSKFSAKV